MWGGWDRAPGHRGSALQASPALQLSRESHGSQNLKALGDRYFRKKKRLFRKKICCCYLFWANITTISCHRKKWQKCGLSASQTGHMSMSTITCKITQSCAKRTTAERAHSTPYQDIVFSRSAHHSTNPHSCPLDRRLRCPGHLCAWGFTAFWGVCARVASIACTVK